MSVSTPRLHLTLALGRLRIVTSATRKNLASLASALTHTSRGRHAFAGVHARRSITVPLPRNNGPGMAWRREALTANWNRALARPGTTHRRHPRPQPQVNNARAYRLRFRVSLRFKSCSYANRLFVLNADRPLSAPLEPQTRSQSHGYTAVRLDLSPSCHVR